MKNKKSKFGCDHKF